jgi:hypothetical protein
MHVLIVYVDSLLPALHCHRYHDCILVSLLSVTALPPPRTSRSKPQLGIFYTMSLKPLTRPLLAVGINSLKIQASMQFSEGEIRSSVQFY